MGPTGRLPAMMTNTTRRQDLTALQRSPIRAASRRALSDLFRGFVFAMVDDPVGSGFVVSLSRPGGDLTGFTPIENSLGGKWVELLKEIAPRVARVAISA